MDRDEWRKELVEWLETFEWQWFCSLTYRPGLSAPQARSRLRRWADALREELGTDDFGWAAVRELGRTGMDLHYHALVKGLRHWHAPERIEWMRRWWKMAGQAQIDIYDPAAGGVTYILKNLDPNDPESLEIEIQHELFPPAEQMLRKMSAK